jgi:hypothetical protein
MLRNCLANWLMVNTPALDTACPVFAVCLESLVENQKNSTGNESQKGVHASSWTPSIRGPGIS